MNQVKFFFNIILASLIAVAIHIATQAYEDRNDVELGTPDEALTKVCRLLPDTQLDSVDGFVICKVPLTRPTRRTP